MEIKKPYSLEIWEEEYVSASVNNTPAHWDEKKVVVIGADDMDFQGKAYNINLTKNIYGEIKLNFSIDGKYVDILDGSKVENYLIKYIFNEVKVKLKYCDEWFDFIIKNINESHNDRFTLTCSCQQLAAYELSKTGYEIKFSMDDDKGSAVQQASAFMDTILQDTEWQYDEAGIAGSVVANKRVDLCEYSKEITYLRAISGSESFTYYEYSIVNGQVQKGTSHTVTSGYFFVPYSQTSKTNEDCFVYYSSQEEISLAEDNLIGKKDLVIVRAPASGWSVTDPTKYSAETPQKSAEQTYISYIDYENTGNSINQYCYGYNYTTDTNPPQTVSGYYRQITRQNSYGYKLKSESVPTYRGFIETLKASGSEKDIYITGDLVPNNYAAIKVPIGSSTIYGANSPIDLYKDGETYYAYINNKISNKIECTKTESIPSGADVYSTAKKTYYKKKYTYDGNIIYQEYKNLDSFGGDNNWYICTGVLQSSVSELTSTDLVYNVWQFFTVHKTNNKIDDIQIVGYSDKELSRAQATYYYYQDNNGNYYFNETNGTYSTTAIQGATRYSRQNINPVYSYNMYRTLEAEKSNCFNLTQDVAETFEVWCRYYIEHDANGKIGYDSNGRRKKWVTLVSDYGKENDVGFTYGLNANSIQRQVETSSLATKIYVDNCESSISEDGIVSIAYADNNISGESFIFNFDYFIQMKMLNAQNVANDLYHIEGQNFNALTSTSYISGNGDAAGYLRHLGLLNDQYDTLYETVLGIGENSLTNQYVQATTKYNAYNTACLTEGGALTPATESGSEIQLTLEQRRAKDQEMRDYYQNEVQNIQTQINKSTETLQSIVNKKKTLHQEFNKKYQRFIQEGTWSDSSYIDHNSYYNDALKVSYDSARPSITYTIDAFDLSILDGYRLFGYDVGDITWIEDTDYFGYQDNGKPYHEKVVVKEISYNLDSPSQTKITIANYSNDFSDLFQRLNATIQSYQLNQQVYNRSSNLTSSGTLEYISLQDSFNRNKSLTLIDNNVCTMDNNGITIKNGSDPKQIVKLVSGGIVLSDDGGENYTTGIYAGEINTELIKSGTIHTENLTIQGSSSNSTLNIHGANITGTKNGSTVFSFNDSGVFTINGAETSGSGSNKIDTQLQITGGTITATKTTYSSEVTKTDTIFAFDSQGNLTLGGALIKGQNTSSVAPAIYIGTEGTKKACSIGSKYIVDINDNEQSIYYTLDLFSSDYSPNGIAGYISTGNIGAHYSGYDTRLEDKNYDLNKNSYYPTSDSTPGSKNYYVKNNSGGYDPWSGTYFNQDTIYYEKGTRLEENPNGDYRYGRYYNGPKAFISGQTNYKISTAWGTGSSASKTDWSLLIGTGSNSHAFGVDQNGQIYATQAYFSDNIYADGGYFNNVVINETCTVNGRAIEGTIDGNKTNIDAGYTMSLNNKTLTIGTGSNAISVSADGTLKVPRADYAATATQAEKIRVGGSRIRVAGTTDVKDVDGNTVAVLISGGWG